MKKKDTFVFMKWIGERISFVDNKDKTTVVIYPDAPGWLKMAMGAWVSMWWTIGIVAIWSFTEFDLTRQETVILAVFLSFWAYYAYRVTKAWLWFIWGKELIKIDEVSFNYKLSTRKIGTANQYYIENISKMRLHAPKENSFQAAWEKSPWIAGGERLEFDYMGKVVRLGRKLNERDAKLLFKFLTKKIEDKLKKKR